MKSASTDRILITEGVDELQSDEYDNITICNDEADNDSDSLGDTCQTLEDPDDDNGYDTDLEIDCEGKCEHYLI